MGITSIFLQLERKENYKVLYVKKSKVNYWGNIFRAAGSTHFRTQ